MEGVVLGWLVSWVVEELVGEQMHTFRPMTPRQAIEGMEVAIGGDG